MQFHCSSISALYRILSGILSMKASDIVLLNPHEVVRVSNLKLRMSESIHLVVFIVREKKDEGVETPPPLCVCVY